MELKVNCVPVCSGMCSELDSQKVDNAVKLKRERSLRRVSYYDFTEYVVIMSGCFALFVFVLFYVMQEKIQKILLSF